MEAISVNNLVKRYGNILAVDDISFTINEGEFFGFLGENGAGKSTTIKMLSTILKPTSGQVKIFNYTLGKEDEKIRNKVGIVFQHSVLDGDLSVKENIMTRGGYYGLSGKEIQSRLNELTDLLDYQEIKSRKYKDLSGGQRRRVDLIRALINRPKILFLDEPTSGLDSKARKSVWQYLYNLRKALNITIFLTTHYLEETNYCDNLVIIDKGKIIANDSLLNLKNTYTYPKLLWYVKRQKENEELIKNFTFNYDKDHYSIKFKGDINQFLYLHKDKITDFEYIKANMDDVFLNITGRKLQHE